MATNDIRTRLETVEDFVVTNLHSLASGNIWRSAKIDDASPHHDQVMISFSLVCSAGVVAEENINFYWAKSDEAGANEIVDVGVADSEGEISVANEISDVKDLETVHDIRIDRASQTIKGSFIVFSPGPSWQLLIELDSVGGAFAGSGSIVRYRFGTPQIQP